MKIKATVKAIYGEEPQFDLSRQAFHQSCLLSAFALLAGLIMAVRLGVSGLVAVMALCMIVLGLSYSLSRFWNNFSLALFLFALVAYSMLVASFFLTEGLNGSTALVSILALCLLYASSESNYHWIWTFIHGLLFLGLAYLDYSLEDGYINNYPSEIDRYIDFTLAYTVVITFMLLTFGLIRRSYERQSLKIEVQRKDLAGAKEELEEANAELIKLLSVLAHDVRNPMASIQSFLELANSGVELSPDEESELKKGLLSMVQGTSHMLDDLVNYSKQKVDGQMASFAERNLGDWLDQTLDHLKQIAEFKGVHLKTSYNPHDRLYCDSILMTVVVRNLIQNAIKYTAQGKQVDFRVGIHENNFVFVISDEGTGMSEENVSKLFTNSIVSKLGVREERGTGLGLLLVKDYVDAHHGTIDVHSSLGAGTRISVSIPKDKGVS